MTCTTALGCQAGRLLALSCGLRSNNPDRRKRLPTLGFRCTAIASIMVCYSAVHTLPQNIQELEAVTRLHNSRLTAPLVFGEENKVKR